MAQNSASKSLFQSAWPTRFAASANNKHLFSQLLQRTLSRNVFIYPLFVCGFFYVFIIMKAGPQTSISRRYALIQKNQLNTSHTKQSSFSGVLDKLTKFLPWSPLPECPKPSQFPVEFPWWADDRSERPILNFTAILAEKLKTTESATKNLPPGGHWRPHNCTARDNIAILIPYRNRPKQLKTFLDYMHPFLQRQNVEYTIYIVEQGNNNSFNRALLFNIGFVESRKLKARHDCYYFHDVDLFPENDLNLYNCPKLPRHHTSSLDKHDYRLLYKSLFGGVTAMKTEHFELINGYSNLFYGWGGEDDDFFNRAKSRSEVMRYPRSVASYTMLNHKKEAGNPIRMSVLGKARKIHKADGINSLCHRVKSIDLMPTYTRILADFNQTYQFKTNPNSTMNCDNGEPNYDVFRQNLDKIPK